MNLDRSAVRPRPASVVPVVWLFLGSSWLMSGLSMVALSALLFPGMGILSDFDSTGAFIILWFFAMVGLGAAGLWGALALLKLRASGRRVLELVNWATVAQLGAFALFWTNGLLGAYASEQELRMAAFGVVLSAVLAVPFVWMAKSLRRNEVRWACE